ncbi:MAG: GDSL-type esterase/lipase family protein [Spirochaetales bacterium]|nr:GDSL-type esterase/lipase family protein [Spirochaetales bacterium]
MKKRIIKITLLSILSALILGALIFFSYLYFTGLSGFRIYKDGENTIKVACVGDSVTYGYGITNWRTNNYPYYLGKLLGEEYSVNNYGLSGYSVQTDSNKPYPFSSPYKKSLEFDPDIVVFMLGSNDSKPFNWKGEEKFKKEYLSLFETYKDSSVILCTVATAFYNGSQESGITSYDIQPPVIDKISEIIREVSEEYGYPLLDIHALTSLHPEWFQDDRVHPNKEGAKAIAEVVAEYILSLEI